MSQVKSTKTTKAGIIGGGAGLIAGLVMVLQQLQLHFDGNPDTIIDWNQFAIGIAAILAGLGIGRMGLVARDDDVSSEGYRATKAKMIVPFLAVILLGGCCSSERIADRAYVNMVDSAGQSIYPEYLGYVNNDATLNDDEKRIRRETVESVNSATKVKLDELQR